MLESSNNLKLKLIKKIFIRTGDFFTQNSRGELYQNVESDSAQFCEFVINNIISIFVTIVNLLKSWRIRYFRKLLKYVLKQWIFPMTARLKYIIILTMSSIMEKNMV